MSRTIVQEYGPIYGEPVNGTVMGRPNGSVYVPLSNTITLSVPEIYQYGRYYKDGVWFIIVCDDQGTIPPTPADGMHAVAVAQDLSSNIQMQVYDDAALTNLIAVRDMPAGQFNQLLRSIHAVDGDNPSTESTYYLRAQLMNNGVAVATSNVIELEVVSP